MSNLFINVLSISITCSFIIVFAVLLDKIFSKNYSRKWIYIIWAVIAIRLILPVNLNIIDIPVIQNADKIFTKPIQSINEANDLIIDQAGNDLSADNQQIETDTADIMGNESPKDTITQKTMADGKSNAVNELIFCSILEIITIIWMIGALLFLSYHLLAYYIFVNKLNRWSISINNTDYLEQFHSLCSELNIKHHINLVTCNQVTSPILIGIIKPCIVLPSENFTMEQFNFIIKHELIHYKQHDLFYKIILLCANAMHWFNPLIYYMVYLANAEIELYCDERLIGNNNLQYRENYSITLLQIMTGTMKNNQLLLSTGFSNRNKQVKKRFFQIMNAKPTKRGTYLMVSLICLLILSGNLIGWFVPAANAEINNKQTINGETNSELTQDLLNGTKKNASDQLEKASNILVVGIDTTNSDKYARADSIIIVSVDPANKQIDLTSFLRDMYLEIPDHGKNKLSAVYQLGGADLIKNTLESNFNLTIDHTVTVNMNAFVNIINSIGGVEIELTKQEAQYLNSTNYISNKKYRTLTAGKQILNGNQALGYVRVRNVATPQGEKGDLGRTARLRSLLSTVIKEYSKNDIIKLIKLFITIIPNVTTDISVDQMTLYLNAALQDGVSTNTLSIPVEDSYTQKIQGGMSILDPDLDTNRMVLKHMFSE